MLNFKYSHGPNEYLKFSIHIFTTVKWQTILQIVTIYKLNSVLKVLAYILSSDVSGLALVGLGFVNPEPGPNSGLAKARCLA